MAQTPSLRVRFRFNRGGSDRPLREKARAFTLAVVDNIGEVAADQSYNQLKSRIRDQIQTAVQTEIQNIASIYLARVIGAQRNRLQGNLTSVAKSGSPDEQGRLRPVESVPLANLVEGPWAARSERYLRRKQRKLGHTRWFESSGFLGSAIRSADNWISWFGPIRVRVFREKEKRMLTPTIERFAVGRVEVQAFGNITPRMLPALASGNIFEAFHEDGRSSGLIDLVAAHSPEAAFHLAGGRTQNVPYRPTLEPFLTFLLTRSVPAAVFSRIQNLGLSDVGSAGRVRSRE